MTNAATSHDYAYFYLTTSVDQIEHTLPHLAEILLHAEIDDEEFYREKDVVLEERKLRYENSPNGQLFIRTMMSIYDGTPYGTPVIGSIEDVKKVSRDEVFDYFKKYYAPNNAVLVIAGDFSEKKTLKLIEQNFGSIPSSTQVEAAKKIRENEQLYVHNFKEDKTELLYGQSENPLFMMAMPARASVICATTSWRSAMKAETCFSRRPRTSMARAFWFQTAPSLPRRDSCAILMVHAPSAR